MQVNTRTFIRIHGEQPSGYGEWTFKAECLYAEGRSHIGCGACDKWAKGRTMQDGLMLDILHDNCGEYEDVKAEALAIASKFQIGYIELAS